MDEELVILVQGYPALYDMSHKDYDNHLVKENMWKEIAESLNKTAEECKSKWALLRSYFVKARNRRKTTSGQAAKKVKKWRLEDQMQFLTPFLQDRITQSNVTDTDPDEPAVLEDDTENANDSTSTSSTPLVSPASASSVRQRYARQQSKAASSSQPEQGLEQTLRSFIVSRTSSETSSEKNALMVFFNDIAESMLKFTERERAEMKRDIFRIVNDKEIEKLIQRERSVPANLPAVLQPTDNANGNEIRNNPSTNSGNQLIPIHYSNYLQTPTNTPMYDPNYYNQQNHNEQPHCNIQQQQTFNPTN